MNGLGILVPIAFFASIYGIFYLFVRRRERLALIEKNLTAKIFNTESNISPSLKYGILCIGIAIGFIIGEILCQYTLINEGIAYFSMVFLFGGISLVIYYFIARKHKA